MKLYKTLVYFCLFLTLGLLYFSLCRPEPETIMEANTTEKEAIETENIKNETENIKNETETAPTATPAPTETQAPTPTPTATPEPTPTETPTPTPTEAPEPTQALDPVEVELIGRTIWGEAGGVKSKAERAAVAWCILNRVDSRGQTIEEVVTAPDQFHGYRPADKWGECPQRHLDLAADVLARWYAEKEGAQDVGRVLPPEYRFFRGDGERNHFSIKWQSTDYWDWSLPDPYKQ